MTERFELIEQVGRGAMGIVWKARDNERGKIVAVKMLRDLHADDPEYIERFAREVDLASSVRSPHVVRVRGYGAREGVPFLVLEFVASRSLRARIADDGPFPPAEARDLLAQIAEALAAVHAAGIVHRDVKASNVLLTEDGVAKLTDFGIARGDDARGSTRHGSLLGTPAYMAPEGPVDARSDLYSLGVLYYELLSGVLPFVSTNYQEVILAHVKTMPDLTRLPASERGLTGWLLSKSPSERPQSAEILLKSLRSGGAAALGTAAGSRSTSSPSPSPSTSSIANPARMPPEGGTKARGSSWTQSPTHTPTPTPVPAPKPAGRPYEATYPRTAGPGSRRRDRQTRSAVLAFGLFSLVALAAVIVFAAGANGSAATAVQPQQGSAGISPVLVVVSVLALGAVAIAATMVVSRARARPARNPGLSGTNRRGVPPNVPKPRSPQDR